MKGLATKFFSTISNPAEHRPQAVQAVFDDELWSILKDLGLLEKLDAGQLHCPITGLLLNRENVGGLIGSPDGPLLISDSASHLMAQGR